MTFEEYLEQIHAEDYTGLDDDMPDRFDSWLTDLQVDDLMTYAQEWGDTRYKEGREAEKTAWLRTADILSKP